MELPAPPERRCDDAFATSAEEIMRCWSVACGLILAGCGGTTLERPGPESRARDRQVVAGSPVDVGAKATEACARKRPGTGAMPVVAVREGSAVALAAIGERTIAYAADEDEHAIHTIDVDSKTAIAVTPIGGAPAQILVLGDGRVAVAVRDENRVDVLEPRPDPAAGLEGRCTTAVAAEPVGLAGGGDGLLLVSSAWGRRLTALATSDLAVQWTAPLAREARGVLVNGERAFVSHAVGSRLSVVDLGDDHGVHTVDLRRGGREANQGMALASLSLGPGEDVGRAAGASRVLVPLVSVDAGDRGTSAGYGGTRPPVTPHVAVIDAAGERPMRAPLEPGFNRHTGDCLLPRAAVVRESSLLVACLGIDAIVELDARASNPAEVVRRRFPVPAGPAGIAVDPANARLLAWSQFAREVSIVDLTAGSSGASAVVRVPVARPEKPRMEARVARGRALFHATEDPRLSKDGRACASCHPDGRDDGLTWSTPDGPRQTIMLAGRVEGSAPYGWHGKHARLHVHVDQTMARLGGRGLSTTDSDVAELEDLMAYLSAMRGPRRPAADSLPAERARLVERGLALFDDSAQGCASCHARGGSDGRAHDVKSGRAIELSVYFDTPSLAFVGGTAPYFHDGRYATLEQVLELADGSMGHTFRLSRSDLLALAAYLETL